MVNFLVKMIIIITLIFSLLLLEHGDSIQFSFDSFSPNIGREIDFENDAHQAGGKLQLTRNQAIGALTSSNGRASYNREVQLWDPNTKRLTDFITHFTFVIRPLNASSVPGDGLAFFIAPFDSRIPANSSGGYLGLVSPEFWNGSSDNPFVAVEFDTYQDDIWDRTPYDHVGIDINSISSVTSMPWTDGSMKDGRKANAWVSYNSTSQNLSVFLTYDQDPVFTGNSTLSYVVDLTSYLPERVRVGFSAGTGDSFEIHEIHSWSFKSSLELIANTSLGAPSPAPTPSLETAGNGKGKGKLGLKIGLAAGFCVIICGLGTVWFIIFWRKREATQIEEDVEHDVSIDCEFERGAGPKRFTYQELRLATNDFAEEGKLGEGGFGGVYKGLLRDSNTEVAVKRISKASSQGKREYISEVKIISLLRHRNLVQLIGWCHMKDEFLLVYEYLSNRSLDFHLFSGTCVLPWTTRHKIALGLASALLYLHEEWEQCVVHRDIKSSNVMLDSNFNAKLGDFGLARIVDHEFSLHTVNFAGTLGYIAPECLDMGKVSKESDVYSFGVVALEICCGRRPIVANVDEPNKVRLVGWLWELYGKGQLLEAVDEGLRTDFDVKQIECLMIVGLWCCHSDPSFRPTIKQVMNVLNFEAPLPRNLPQELPKPMYFVPPHNITPSNSSSVATGSSTGIST